MASVIPPGQVKYPPELLANIEHTDVNAGATAKPLELKDFGRKPNKKVANVLGLAGANVTSVTLRLSTDEFDEMDVPSFGTIDRTEEFVRFAEKLVSLVVYNGSANNLTGDPPNPSYKNRLNFGVYKPSIIDKLVHGMALSSDEEKLATKYQARKLVEYGIAPKFNPNSPFDIGNREVLDQVAIADEITLPAGGTSQNYVTLGEYFDIPGGEVYILYELSTDGAIGVPTDGVKVAIERDGQEVMVIDNYAMPAIERAIPLWIPALDYLHLKAWATNVTASFNFVYKFAKCRMTLEDYARWFTKSDVEFVDAEHERLFDLAQELIKVGLPLTNIELGV